MTRKALFIPDLLPSLLPVAYQAGIGIMQHYKMGRTVDRKDDQSPVTEADREADRLIVKALKMLSSFPIVSEEGEKPDVSQADYFWLVDPLDGTKSFIRGSGYFTVNIGLIDNATQLPVAGIIYDPAHKTMYYGSGAQAFRRQGDEDAKPIHVHRANDEKRIAIVSHSHLNTQTEEYLRTLATPTERIPCASSIKFCWLAEGRADLYPRFGPTMEWDTAAGHAILLAAGGNMQTPENQPFTYGKKGFLNGNFIATGADASQ